MNYYTSPNPKDNELNLAFALSLESPLEPGDFLFLRGGVYTGKFECFLDGTEENPITICSAPGEWAIIDSGITTDRKNIIQNHGSYLIFKNFEITSSNPKKKTLIYGSFPSDITQGEGIASRGTKTKFINLVVHDTAQGISSWGDGEEIIGCVLYNNGWLGDKPRGHNIYTQNSNFTKTIKNNIIFDAFDRNIQIYGSDNASLKNYVLEGNVIFNAGIHLITSLGNNITLSGGIIENILIKNNYFYGFDRENKLVLGSEGCKGLILEGNYIPHRVNLRDWTDSQIKNNLFHDSETILELKNIGTIDCNNNTYYSLELKYSPFNLITSSGTKTLNFDQWRTVTNYDSNSTYIKEIPPNSTIVLPKSDGEFIVVLYNWSQQEQLEIPFQWKENHRYQIFDVHNLKTPLQEFSAPTETKLISKTNNPHHLDFECFVIKEIAPISPKTLPVTITLTVGGKTLKFDSQIEV